MTSNAQGADEQKAAEAAGEEEGRRRAARALLRELIDVLAKALDDDDRRPPRPRPRLSEDAIAAKVQAGLKALRQKKTASK